jgi:hydrogenase maturation protease
MKNSSVLSMILVIGYGNTLRGDDSVGCQVAEAVASWQIPYLRSLAVHQLLPELAETIAEVDTVIFVDAAQVHDFSPHNITCERLAANRETTLRTHFLSPQLLLGLTQHLYHATPDACLITIPATDFTFGNPLSAIALDGKNAVLSYLKNLINTPFMP